MPRTDHKRRRRTQRCAGTVATGQRKGCRCRKRTRGRLCNVHAVERPALAPLNLNGPCPICLSAVRSRATLLPCNHHYHRRCIKKWWARSNDGYSAACPYCRAEFVLDDIEDEEYVPPRAPSPPRRRAPLARASGLPWWLRRLDMLVRRVAM